MVLLDASKAPALTQSWTSTTQRPCHPKRQPRALESSSYD